MKISIKDKEFKAKVARTDASKYKGLSGIASLPKGSALVLYYKSPEVVPISMRRMKFPIAAIWVKDDKVQAIKKLKVGDEDTSISAESDYVIEINENEASGIRKGQEVSWIGSTNSDDTVEYKEKGGVNEGGMHVLDSEGNVQMETKGNERIFSRPHTKRLIDLSNKASDDKGLIKLGKEVVKILGIHDTQKPQYVED